MNTWKRVIAAAIAAGLVVSMGQAANASPLAQPPYGGQGQLSGTGSDDGTANAEVSDPETTDNGAVTDESDQTKPGEEKTDSPDVPENVNSDPQAPASPTETTAPAPPAEQPTSVPVPPTEIPVAGVLAEVIAEPIAKSADGHDEHEGAHEMAPGWVSLLTDEGTVLPLDETSLAAEAKPGDRVSGALELQGEAKQSVQEALVAAPDGALTTSEMLTVAATAIVESGQPAVLLEEKVLPAPVPSSGVVSVKPHSADVVFFSKNTVSQETKIRAMMSKVSSFWKKESEGKVNGIAVNTVKQVVPKAGLDVCDPDVAWDAAAALFPGVSYWLGNPDAAGAPNPRHLTVIIDRDCSGHPENALGWAYLLDVHTGGMNFANIGAGLDYVGGEDTIIHEFGHNLGLHHSNQRNCGAYSDAAPSNVTFSGNSGTFNPGKLCRDREYSDFWSPMGSGVGPTSLPYALKVDRGFLARPTVITEKGGITQRFTLNTVSASSGLRGIIVKHTAGSEEFALEYRSGTGQDAIAATMYDGPARKGVRAVKMVSTDGGGPMSTGIYGPYLNGVKAGGTLQPYGGRARVTVESMTSSAANIRVDFTTSFDDVVLSHRSAGAIQWMRDNGIATGIRKPDNTVVYGPAEQVSREAMAAFMFRAYAPDGYKAGSKGKLPFTDISTSHRFYKEIYWMWERGVTTGTKQADGSVRYLPADPVSREAMAAFLYRASGANYAPPAKSPFVDVPTTHKFYRQISWMYGSGITTGTVTSKGREYQPKVATTREMMATFMQRASKL